jgi:hypothetical protein
MQQNRVFREGTIAGILGASAVALWFLVVDIVASEPLHTPRILGHAFFSMFGAHPVTGAAWPVLGYTVVHYAAFIGVGLLVAKIIEMSNRTPAVLAGLFLVFAVIEVGFYMLAALLSAQDVLGQLAWYQVLAANLLAAGLMGGYLLRKHPEAMPRLDAALKGTTP